MNWLGPLLAWVCKACLQEQDNWQLRSPVGDLSDECVALVGLLVCPLRYITQVRIFTLWINWKTYSNQMQWEWDLMTFLLSGIMTDSVTEAHDIFMSTAVINLNPIYKDLKCALLMNLGFFILTRSLLVCSSVTLSMMPMSTMNYKHTYNSL